MAHDIKLTPYQRELKERYTKSESMGNSPELRVSLAIGNQEFRVDLDFAPDEADWTRSQLAKALNTLIINERNDSYGQEGDRPRENA